MNDIPLKPSKEATAFATGLSAYVRTNREFENVGVELSTLLDDRQRQRVVHVWQGFVAGRQAMGSP